MTDQLSKLSDVHRLLFKIPLEPVLGHRFQPTGFPSLGAATFQTPEGTSLLVESAQSMANWLELTVWDEAKKDIKEALTGLSHVRVEREGEFLTDTILESHRLNSPYVLGAQPKPANGDDQDFPTWLDKLRSEFGVMETGPIDRKKLAETLLKYDIGSLLHGVFLAKKELAGGRLRVARSLSAFIEADGVRIAPSGGVKNDHVNPQGVTKDGFGNVPFARDEYTAEAITLYGNLDLAQIRGYGLGQDAENLLILLALYKLRCLIDDGMRLRTACDLKLKEETVSAFLPESFGTLPSKAELQSALKSAIGECTEKIVISTAVYNAELKKGKEEETANTDIDPDETE